MRGAKITGPRRHQNQRFWLFSAKAEATRDGDGHATDPCLFNHLQLHFRDDFVSNGNQTWYTVKWLKTSTRSEEALLLIVQSSVLRWP